MLETDRQNDVVVVKPKGTITATNVEEFRAELNGLVEDGVRDITIDLADVNLIDSKGLAVFILCHQTLSSKGGKLTVISDNADLRELFHVMRLDERFTVKGSA